MEEPDRMPNSRQAAAVFAEGRETAKETAGKARLYSWELHTEVGRGKSVSLEWKPLVKGN